MVRALSSPPAHRATTANLQAVYPFVSSPGFDTQGPLIGRNLLGGAFSFDPWQLYRQGILTNPNALVVGQIGRGKSTFIKTFVWRQLPFGRQAWILDPKGEYGALAEASGGQALKLFPGGKVRLNPLALPGVNLDPEAAALHRGQLIGALVASSLGRALAPPERAALDVAVRMATMTKPQPALPDVTEALLHPAASDATDLGTDAAGLAADGRVVALELRRLVEGDLAGMFDRQTSAGLDRAAAVIVVDLSAIFSSPALPLVMTCATAWLQSLVRADPTAKRLIVVDEAWAVLRDLATARWLQASFKLSRSLGVANLAVVHRFSDLGAAGSDGSAEQRLAQGLLADSETRVVFGQPPSEAELSRQLLGLTDCERQLVSRLPRGTALWKVGEHSFVVEHTVARSELALVDTDRAMADAVS